MDLGIFELRNSIGQGGMGEVYEAVHRRQEVRCRITPQHIGHQPPELGVAALA